MTNQHFTLHEQQLVAACKNGDRQAQRELYNRYVDAMYNTAVRMLNDRNEAQDVLQEVFVKVFNKLDYFRGESSMGAWIKRITITTTLNYIEKHHKINYAEMSETMQVDADDRVVETSTLDMETVHHAIKMLPDGCREILSLYLIEGYTHLEIAEILHVSVGTSKSQYSRAKRLLRAIITQQYVR